MEFPFNIEVIKTQNLKCLANTGIWDLNILHVGKEYWYYIVIVVESQKGISAV